MIEPINPESVLKPISNYSNGIACNGGRLLFVSGQVGATAKMEIAEGAEAQARLAFENVRAIVEAAGGTLKDIVSLTLYVSDISDAQAVNKVRNELFGEPPYPTSTMIGNCTFVAPPLLFEVSAIAALPGN